MPPYVEPKTVKSDVQTPLPLTSTSGAGDLGSANVDRDKHTSILDYSAKLEGISLEDFFTNQVKPQAPAQSSETFGNFEDLFGNFSNMKERSVGESVNCQSNNGLVNNGDLLGLDTNIQNSLKADTQNSSDVDSLFGSGWHLNVPPFMAPTTSDSQGSKKQSSLLESNKEDLLGPISSQLMETRIVNNSSFAFVEELTSTATNDDELLTERQTSPSTEKKNKIVRSLLAQLPDLSFLLADKLVMNTEGQKTNPDTSR